MNNKNNEELQILMEKLAPHQDSRSLYLYFKILCQIGKISDALDFLEEKNTLEIIFPKYQKKVFLEHISLLIDAEEYARALRVIEHYQDLPYVSYEMEELFKEYKQKVLDEIDGQKKKKISS